ncbi:Holliday junction resolvase RuvX [Flaviaesturariibacter flavus]|uniref:Putative pre-16S rRNA nuclease n=1 Tax=Flaviaesturariibacter flavus TaxID=2502780 RepID=A0A4R1BJG6_9BACT|nr:Holliday junction resolvase RuvX [Flaviaesturariibacter flavus]TCJ17434.1 Holliday junction resolvase RuvX [Flaviaesturariibacter flavus]
MGRIMAIDYGGKRTGLAVTDPLQIIATGLMTIETHKLLVFLKDYIPKEGVERVLIGMPTNWDDTDTHITESVRNFSNWFRKQFPAVPLEEIDERYSSKLASQAISQMGLSKKKREQKGLIDEVAATMMLQQYLSNR